MKKIIIVLTLAALLLTGTAMAESSVFTGESVGKIDVIRIEMTVENNLIKDVQVTEQHETAGIADAALTGIPAAIVDQQSLAIDTISGATVTSEAILAACEEAAIKANLDMAALKTKKSADKAEAEPVEETADVIVIGAGGAGLAAAASAGEHGASVIVLEANGIIGGSTIRSGGHMLLFDEQINASMERNDDSLAKYLDYSPEDFGEWAPVLETAKAQISAYLIGDKKMLDAINEAGGEGFVDKMTSRGEWFIVADTLEEAIAQAGLPADTLTAIESFNSCVDSNLDAEFGRTKFNGKVESGPFAVVKMVMHYHLTFGGLVIDTDAHVLDTEGRIIDGLYAAGDIISGFEGDAHQSGDCITTVLFYGKVAGANAAQ